MNVSRETSLAFLLERFADSLDFNSKTLMGEASYLGLTRPALVLFILSLFNKINDYLFLIFEDGPTAEKLYFDCLNIAPNSPLYFPASSTSEIDIKGFNLENERYRSEVVNYLRTNRIGIIFTSEIAANELAIDNKRDTEAGFTIKPRGKINRQVLIEAFTRWGYETTDHTETPKTFSIRGGILDVFLPYSAQPIRLEFFGDEIESIRVFNPRSQRTIKTIDYLEILPPPTIKNDNTGKISLKNMLDSTPLFIKKNGNLFNVILGVTSGSINLECKSIVLDGPRDSAKEITVNDAMALTGTQNTYLFSGDQKFTTVINKYGLDGCNIIKTSLSYCFYSSYINVFCVSLAELNRQPSVSRSRWTIETISEIPQKDFSSLDDIGWGDYLVHQDFGIGLYRGLEIIKTHENIAQEFIKIEYADRASVYVPVEKFNRVHKMIMTGSGVPVLSTLNSPKWSRQKQVAKNTAREAVKDLINLYASRNRKRGFVYDKNNSYMSELQSSFPYDETPGQRAAINDVISDMENDRPIDRLVCGDVGFGKTEVALRAALKSIISGKKVLLLTPTTILADQHYISTRARFEPLGIKIELLSRFKTKKEQFKILENMLTGSVDMVIGTHRLLSQDVMFPNLGLLIIDEEHRFGVKHKEKLRQLRSTVDVITLTATPIPRTLQQALLGIRDISRITTPPKTRRPIKTFVQYFDWKNIRNIIDLELSRDGQIYFLHNDISSIPFILKKLNEYFPKKIIGVAHGKLNTKELENTVLSFFGREIDVLLCTTIIESGLDVSNANTIIINNAQNFGLSQLYQIRGRVGRSHRQAYCHLLLPRGKTIGENARKRLKAIEQYTTLGSGYDISMKDLEIRGAGNLFGYKQSGHIAKVGFEMYCKLLQEAVDETIGSSEQKQVPKISIPLDALLDSEYIQLVQDRLYFYQQLSDAVTIETVNTIEEELRDRFGVLPIAAKNLLTITKIRIRLTGSSVSSLSIIGSELKIRLSDFKPFKSVDHLISVVSDKMNLNNLKLQFAIENDGLVISVTPNNTDYAVKTIGLFVSLFSN